MRFCSKLKLLGFLYQLAISSMVNSSGLGKNLKFMSYE